MRIRNQFVCCAVIVLWLYSAPSHALFHLFDFVEVFSNEDGTIQFIEMATASDNQNLLRDHEIIAASNPDAPFTFDEHLPNNETSERSILIATAGFASLPGAVAPDYILPDNFFSIDGDTLTFVGGAFSDFSWETGELPIDGVMSLNRSIGGGTNTSAAVNSPTNFAGDTGSIDLGGGSDPAELFVDFAAPDNGDGTQGAPFNTIADAVAAIPDGGTVFVLAGDTDETILIEVAKSFFVEALGGTVVIGLQPAPPQGFRSRGSAR